ncbi:AsmA family protein [Sideroxydans sp. CL21]|uniref:AsmA family protein n=1 Tax=Sideroxydans sp. CL21 TaxID=2600596 RepID=UPI0024BD0B8E|nr:AsmA family protein [Sideroxydans sp. CL21]
MFFRVLRVMAVLAALVLGCIAYVAIVGISFDASPQRDKVAALLEKSLGREVRFEGAMKLEVSARPKLHVGGLHIANAQGFEGEDFASLGDAHLALNLWALMRLRLQIDELSGSDVHIRLQLNKNGSNNWTFKAANRKANVAQPSPKAATGEGMELEELLARLDIKSVSLENLNVKFTGANGNSHFFELQSLVAHLPEGQPLTLALNGTVEKKYPYKMNITGGTFADLVRFDKPWPLDMSLDFLSSRLTLKGNVSGSSGDLHFGLVTDDLGEIERLFQTRLPAVGVTRISGDIKYAPGKVAMDNLSGAMGKTTLNGSLGLDYSGERPSVSGELVLPVLDVRPFMTGKAVTQDEPPEDLAQMYQEFVKATFSLNDLNSANADLTLRIGQLIGFPGAVRDAVLQVKLEQGRLSLPLQATVADVKLSGSAIADASVKPPRFKLSLGTHDSNLGNLAELLLGARDVRGRLGRFDLRIAARGDRGPELMDSLDVQLLVKNGKLTYGSQTDEHPVKFSLDDLKIALPAGKALRGEAHGSLLDKNFSATLNSGSLTAIMQESHTPVDFELLAGSAKVEIHAVLQPSTENSGSKVAFELSAPHSGEIAGWLGLKPGVDEPIGVHGNFRTHDDRWHLADFALQLGHSALHADVLRTFGEGRSLIKFQLTADLVDVDELESMLPESSENTHTTTSAASNLIDLPILPKGINLADADITVRVKRITSSSPLEVHNLSFDGRIRDGMMPASPFEANVDGNDFKGAILLDLRTQQPHSVLWLSSIGMNIGSAMKKLGIAKNIDVDVDHLRLQLDLHSSRLGKLLAKSDLALDFEGGHLTLHDANTGGKMVILLDNGELKSLAGEPVHLNLRGSLDKAPISIGLETGKAADLINPNLPIPFQLNASMSGATLKLSGDIDRPFAKLDIDLALEMSGTRLDNLNLLANTSLPPWGPWSGTGKLHMSPVGYEVSSLLLQVGSSQLNGHGKLDTSVVPPRIDIELTAPTIQLDDFRFGDWSPEKTKRVATKVPESRDNLLKEADKTGNEAKEVLSPEVLRRQNAFVTVRVDRVVSGQDMLGSGKLDARLENGNAVIGPVIINTPGGSASLRLGYEPAEKDVALKLNVEAKHFDYGILARRIDHKSKMQGTLSLNVDVSARAKYFSELLRYGKGNIDFVVWPKNMKSGLLDMWAVNVLMALLPAIDSSNTSVVNCAVGRFVLNDGKLSGKTLLVDTTRMRVTGKGGVDFTAEKINFYMQPRAKTPQFLSFSLPVELDGNFENFGVGVRPIDVLETMGQFTTSVVWAPLQMMFGKEAPSDGHDVCEVVEFK